MTIQSDPDNLEFEEKTMLIGVGVVIALVLHSGLYFFLVAVLPEIDTTHIAFATSGIGLTATVIIMLMVGIVTLLKRISGQLEKLQEK